MKKIILNICALVALIGQAEVVINEIMADNGGKCQNAAGEAMDWVELYNPSEAPVDLTGWRITDTVEDEWSKWKEIPEGTTVPAGGYLLLWGHNKDFPTPEDKKGFCGVTNGEVHVKLGLSSKGETITLAASEADYNATNFADQVTFGAQFSDVSYGRDPDDTAKWLFFTNATPGAANGSDGLEKYPPEEGPGGEEPGSGGDEEIDGPCEGEFAVMLDVSRPVAGKAMKATVTGERTGNVTFAWFVREPTGAYGDVVCEGREYAPTTANYEHWIRVVATDEGGAEASTEFYFSKLPIVYINTDDGQPVTVKTEYKGAAIRIQGNDLYDQQYEGKTEIKGRGNSSWGFPKKPYKLKLDKKTDLFGFGKNKHWVLISNWLDVCGMRNWTASTLAKELGIIGMDMTWVQVVLNGSYDGTYMLCEHIRVDKNRIDVFDWSDTIESEGHSEEDLSWLDSEKGVDFSGGYIFEMDDRFDEVSKFTTSMGLKVMFNTPEFAATSGKMIDYAKTLWEDFESAVTSIDGYNGKERHFSEVAAIDSMVAFWLVNELFSNTDSLCYSRYAHKDQKSPLTFGPVWDFDVSAESCSNGRAEESETWVVCRPYGEQTLCGRWVLDPVFCQKSFECYWNCLRPKVMDLFGEKYDKRIAFLSEAGSANDVRYDRVGKYELPASMIDPRSFGGDLGDAASFRKFVLKRLAWLDVQFASVDSLVQSIGNINASAYKKNDSTLSVSLGNGGNVGATDATTDFVLNRGEKVPQVRVAVANGVIVKLHAYVNGLKYGIYDVADGKCEFTVSADKMVAERGHRDMVSLIAKDVDGNTIARNYLTILNPPIPQVTVTEIMADNGGSYVDADGIASDWIELYNAGATDADISGWRLCDSTTKKWSKWEELPEGTIVPACGYLIVWADDFTGWTNGEVHVNLGFSSKGEEVALAIAEGEIVDSFAFGPQHTDVSFGRDPSDPEKLVYFKAPTPGAANGNDGIENGDSFNISINELMAENGGKFPNAAGEAMDWLELYNAGAADVNVSGWGFQDDPTKAWSKWKMLPEGAVVPAGGYLLVWGDNKDFNSFTGITNGEVHVNMGLSKKGEGLHLALTNGVGTVVRIDGFDFPKQAPDVSWGRTASDPDKFLYFTEPTPAAANGDAGREALVFSIDFDSDGGTLVASVTNDYGATISAPAAPTRTGYTFAGWCESGAAEPFVFSTMPTRDVALTARWTANEYTVDFNPRQGGEGTMPDQPMVYDEEEALYSNVFCRTGYTFLGWTDDERELAEVIYSDGVVVSNLTDEADGEYDLYAVWAANEYTVTFDANGGSGTMEDQIFLYDEQQPLVSNAFVKANYVFAGWIVRGDTNNVVFADGEVVSNLTAEADGVVTLCAQWKLDGWETISGAKMSVETRLTGYRASGLPKGLTYNRTSGTITGTATKSGEYVVTFTKSGAETRQRVIVVRAEEVSIGCEGLLAGPLPAGVGTAGGIDIQIGNEGGTKSVSVTKLPTGMKYDSKSGKITGTPSTAGNYDVVLTMTTKFGTKETVAIPVSVTAMPETAVGTFNGFVSVSNDTYGTLALTTTAAGKLTAKVVTAAGTVSFSGTSWDSVEKGVYQAVLTARKGEKIKLILDSTAAWNANQLSGEFTKLAGAAYSVSAQRNAFGKIWHFTATGDETKGWTFAFTKEAKAAALTVTLKADGTTAIAGKLPNGKDAKGKDVTVKVSASGYANVGGLCDGAVLADFAPVMTVGGKKKVLAIRTNLWFDRSNDHAGVEYEGIGGAKFVE